MDYFVHMPLSITSKGENEKTERDTHKKESHTLAKRALLCTSKIPDL